MEFYFADAIVKLKQQVCLVHFS